MAIKYTIQGLLIYAAMAGYLLAFVVTLWHGLPARDNTAKMAVPQRKAGHVFFLIGFLVGCAAIAYRWLHVGHIPLQNLENAVIGFPCAFLQTNRKSSLPMTTRSGDFGPPMNTTKMSNSRPGTLSTACPRTRSEPIPLKSLASFRPQ